MERYRDVGGGWRKDNSNYIRSSIASGTDNIAFPTEGEEEKKKKDTTTTTTTTTQKQAHKGTRRVHCSAHAELLLSVNTPRQIRSQAHSHMHATTRSQGKKE